MTEPGGGRLPDPGSEMEAEGIPDLDASPASLEATGDAQEGMAIPRDHAIAADDFGTTAYEEFTGESLDGRLARELPDTLSGEVADDADDEREISDTPFLSDVAGYEVGRLVESDEGARPDTEAELTARSVGTDRGAFSAEEAAMHLDPDN